MSSLNLTTLCAAEETETMECALWGMLQETKTALDETKATQAGMIEGTDTFFLLFGGALVFLMQAGFAMLCAGSVRAKNVKNILLKNMLDGCGGALGFFAIGFGFAYGGEGTFIGNDYFFLNNFDSYAEWFFQFAFAATAATIVAGTVAERCKMAAYLCYSVFLTGFVYPVIVRSIWSSYGFLNAFRADKFLDIGVIDFAGSGVVHLTGGVTALIAAIILGPRRGRFYDEDGNPLENPQPYAPHSVSLQVLGTFILWFGWYGFNPGSALAIANSDSAQVAALCAATTTIAAAAGCVTCMFTDTILDWRATGEASYDLTMAMNGALGGLVAVTAGTSVVEPYAAVFIGMIGGWCYLGCSKLLVKLRIDDAVDAVPVHFANGIWGTIAVGFFSRQHLQGTAGYSTEHYGLFYGGGANLLGAQICCVLWVITWVTVLMVPFFTVLLKAGMFRIDPLEEEVGLDLSHHRGPCYDMTPPKQEDVDALMLHRSHHGSTVDIPKEDKTDNDKVSEDSEKPDVLAVEAEV